MFANGFVMSVERSAGSVALSLSFGLRDLRYGPAFAAFGVPYSTVRSWVRNCGLRIGSAVDSGYPRYGAIDIAMIALMYVLIKRNGIGATRAAFIANSVAELFDVTARAIPTIVTLRPEPNSPCSIYVNLGRLARIGDYLRTRACRVGSGCNA